MLVQNHLILQITDYLLILTDSVKCAAKAAIGLECSVSSLAAAVSLRHSANAETDTSLGGACSQLTMCHPKTGFTA